MKRNLLLLNIILGILFSNFKLYSQTNENIWFDGVSHIFFLEITINISVTDDTLSVETYPMVTVC